MSLETIVGEHNFSINKGLVVVIGDVHVPLHDKKAVKLVRKVMKDIEPDYLFINGDFMDCAEVSSYTKSRKDFSFDDEVKVARKELEEWAKYAKNTIFTYGNHEERIKKYIQKNAPALEGLTDANNNEITSLENLLGFKEKGIQFVDKNYTFVNDKLLISHLYKSGQFGGYIAKNIGMRYNMDVIHGHSHTFGRVDLHNKTFIDNGCLALPVDYTKAPSTQIQAFTVVDIVNKHHYYESVKIDKHKALFGGKLYTGR